MESKKPPDKLNIVKTNIQNIIKDPLYINELYDACLRTHKIVIQSYHFLRLWILDYYHSNKEIPIITKDVIKMIFTTLTVSTKGGNKPQGANLILLNQLNTFYNEKYNNMNYTKINSAYLSQILNDMSTDMFTNIENNVKLHFFKYVKRFVNSSYKLIHNEILEKCSNKKDKIEKRKLLNKELFEIKEDLLNNTLLSDPKYHDWIIQHRNNIFPVNYVNCYEFDIENNPQKYLKSMIYMCLEIEKIGTASYQFFPLRTNIIPRYIPIDTKSLIEILIRNDKKKFLENVEKYKNEIWSQFFNIEDPIFTQSNYKFDYKIYSDCFSVSIQMIHKDFIESEKDKKDNMKNKRNEVREITKNMNQEEKENYKKEKERVKKEENEKYKLELKIKRDKAKEEFKKLPKEEQTRIKEELEKAKKEKKISNGAHFRYLEELNEYELDELRSKNWVTIDPGKKTLLYMKNKEGKKLRYTNRTHVHKTKRLKYERLLQNYKDKKHILSIEKEEELCKHNSKTCNLEKFINYISNKNRLNNLLFEEYSKEIFRKYKYYGYLNRKRADRDLIRSIKRTFGKDTILLYGNWSMKGNCNKGNLSTPNMRLKRLIGREIKSYNFDEYNTSKLNHKTEEKCDNLYLRDKKGDVRKIHSVLTYKMENNQIGCINRDENAVNNMIKIVQYFLVYKSRPLNYCRNQLKGINLEMGQVVPSLSKVQL